VQRLPGHAVIHVGGRLLLRGEAALLFVPRGRIKHLRTGLPDGLLLRLLSLTLKLEELEVKLLIRVITAT
jgi:hypothetical protein